MRGTSPIGSSLRDPVCFFQCRGVEKQINLGVNCRASCSIVPGKALVSKSFFAGNWTHGRPCSRGGRHEQDCVRIGLVRVASRKPSGLRAGGGEEPQVRVGDGEKVGDEILQDWVELDASEGNGRKGVNAVDVTVERTGTNMRKIIAKILIRASLEDVWAILTDYERLADFIPGLAVSELLERRERGCRLYQVGEQDIALGVKFKAKAVVDCEEKSCEVERNLVRRDIDFNTVEGDFQIFKGTWRMEQVSGPSTFVPGTVGGKQERKTFLYYILEVQPKVWLPVALVEGRLTSEIKINLVCIRDRAQKGHAV